MLKPGASSYTDEERNIRSASYSAVHYEAKRNPAFKPDCCQDCGRDQSVQAHHEDYHKPLDVLWLCQPCHLRRHHTGEEALSGSVPPGSDCPMCGRKVPKTGAQRQAEYRARRNARLGGKRDVAKTL